ncbi:hypothetical protein HK098_006989 [Nowakowskiella sp. JEL0407]|nr:hypothetical protein HK098_006989 [Nowakowskiella sp. JEL0407]
MATNDLTTAPMEIQNIMPNLKNTGDQNMDLSSLELFNTDFMSSIQPDLQLQLNQIFATSSQPVPTNPLQPSVDFNTVKPPLLLPSHAPVQQLGRAQIPLPFPGEINSAANFPQQISLLQQQNMIPPQLMLNQMNQTFHSQMAGPDMINGFSPPNQSKSKRFTDTQVSQLLEAFNAKPNQSKEERAELAKQIGLTEEQVRQN